MSDPVNHPTHYNSHPARCPCGRPIECIDVVRGLGFSIGNVIKYCWRGPHKGNPLEDYRKARWYLDDFIKQLEREDGDGKRDG
jgi:hypothetical protein